jgi:hypothetical protein
MRTLVGPWGDDMCLAFAPLLAFCPRRVNYSATAGARSACT